MAIIIEGIWKKGIVLDVHTLDSEYLGVDDRGHKKWKNKRSALGELVYQLKYKSNLLVIPKILEYIEKIKGLEKMDYIIPAPYSKKRKIQPVNCIANSLSEKIAVPVLEDVVINKGTGNELKDIDNIKEKESILEKILILSKDFDIAGKNILLLDDLYDSGATLNAVTKILYRQAHVKDVYVLAMSKTRS